MDGKYRKNQLINKEFIRLKIDCSIVCNTLTQSELALSWDIRVNSDRLALLSIFREVLQIQLQNFG